MSHVPRRLVVLAGATGMVAMACALTVETTENAPAKSVATTLFRLIL